MEDMHVRRMMESSDMPKLSPHFTPNSSLLSISWSVYTQRMKYFTSKFSPNKLINSFDTTNPLITVFTWSVMVPVGGTFCSNHKISLWLVCPFHDV